jgi:hypothetical protein
MADYYLKNKEAILQKGREYRLNNKEKIAQNKRDDMARNGERRRAKQKEWRENNKDKLLADRKRWFQENKQEIYEKRKTCAWTPERQAEYLAEYRVKNKDRLKQRLREYQESCPDYRIKHRHLGRVASLLRKSVQFRDRQVDEIGCTRLFFIAHIESLFKPGMTWDNYGKGGWEIDHKIPCSSFDLTDPEQQKACFHYTNMQPLWWHENIKKGKKILTESK